MAARHVRRLQEQQANILTSNKKKSHLQLSEDSEEEEEAIPQGIKPFNPFDLLVDDEDEAIEDNNSEEEESVLLDKASKLGASLSKVAESSNSKKKKKKKKGGAAKNVDAPSSDLKKSEKKKSKEDTQGEAKAKEKEEDIDKIIAELNNATLDGLASSSNVSSSSTLSSYPPFNVSRSASAFLAVDLRGLKGMDELRRLFGSSVINAVDQEERRSSGLMHGSRGGGPYRGGGRRGGGRRGGGGSAKVEGRGIAPAVASSGSSSKSGGRTSAFRRLQDLGVQLGSVVSSPAEFWPYVPRDQNLLRLEPYDIHSSLLSTDDSHVLLGPKDRVRTPADSSYLTYWRLVPTELGSISMAEFQRAKASYSPNAIAEVLRRFPFQPQALLVMYDLYRNMGDTGMSDDLLSRLLHSFESCWPASFVLGLAEGTARLTYTSVVSTPPLSQLLEGKVSLSSNRSSSSTSSASSSNAATTTAATTTAATALAASQSRELTSTMLKALQLHVSALSRRGCHSSALETAKALFALDPVLDPCGMAAGWIDYLAIRAGKYDMISTFASESDALANEVHLAPGSRGDGSRSSTNAVTALVAARPPLVLTPAFSFSIPLAQHLQAGVDRAANRKCADGITNSHGNMMSKSGQRVHDVNSNAILSLNSPEESLTSAILMHPQVLPLLIGKLQSKGVAKDINWRSLLSRPFFASASNSSSPPPSSSSPNYTFPSHSNAALRHLSSLYVERSHLLWKAPDCLSLLLSAAQAAADVAECGGGGDGIGSGSEGGDDGGERERESGLKLEEEESKLKLEGEIEVVEEQETKLIEKEAAEKRRHKGLAAGDWLAVARNAFPPPPSVSGDKKRVHNGSDVSAAARNLLQRIPFLGDVVLRRLDSLLLARGGGGGRLSMGTRSDNDGGHNNGGSNNHNGMEDQELQQQQIFTELRVEDYTDDVNALPREEVAAVDGMAAFPGGVVGNNPNPNNPNHPIMIPMFGDNDLHHHLRAGGRVPGREGGIDLQDIIQHLGGLEGELQALRGRGGEGTHASEARQIAAMVFSMTLGEGRGEGEEDERATRDPRDPGVRRPLDLNPEQMEIQQMQIQSLLEDYGLPPGMAAEVQMELEGLRRHYENRRNRSGASGDNEGSNNDGSNTNNENQGMGVRDAVLGMLRTLAPWYDPRTRNDSDSDSGDDA